jgi:hypothetical protein
VSAAQSGALPWALQVCKTRFAREFMVQRLGVPELKVRWISFSTPMFQSMTISFSLVASNNNTDTDLTATTPTLI